MFLTLGPDVEQSLEGKSLHDVKRTLDCIHSILYLLCYIQGSILNIEPKEEVFLSFSPEALESDLDGIIDRTVSLRSRSLPLPPTDLLYCSEFILY